MKRYIKSAKMGFTIVELIVSFVMISILSLVIFRTALSIQNKQVKNIAYNSFITFNSTINSVIQRDLVNKIITQFEFCGKNCYKIKYEGDPVKELSLDEEQGILKYGNLLERLPNNFYFYTDIEVKEETFDNIIVGRFNSLLTIRVPINSTILSGSLDLIYVYQYDNRVNVISSKIS